LEKGALPDFEGAVKEFHPEVPHLFDSPAEVDGHLLEGHFFGEALEVALFFFGELQLSNSRMTMPRSSANGVMFKPGIAVRS